MRNFWKDYAELCKAAGRFYKKHWLGCIVLNAVMIAGQYAWFYRDDIKDKLTSKSVKEHKEKESE